MDAVDRMIYAQTDRGTRIGTAHDTIGALRGGMSLVMWYANQARAMGFPFDLHPDGSVEAEVNHGRWLVRCPFCSGAEEADPGEPIFYCLSCGNNAVGAETAPLPGHIMLVMFPDNRTEIEAALLARPDIGTRNWAPGESLQDLAKENGEHLGVEV
jgi:hypothetical protein